MVWLFSLTKYVASVWWNNPHINKTDEEVNVTIIYHRHLQATSASHIPPHGIRTKHALKKECEKILYNLQLMVHEEIPDLEPQRLTSTHPPLQKSNNYLKWSSRLIFPGRHYGRRNHLHEFRIYNELHETNLILNCQVKHGQI